MHIVTLVQNPAIYYVSVKLILEQVCLVPTEPGRVAEEDDDVRIGPTKSHLAGTDLFSTHLEKW